MLATLKAGAMYVPLDLASPVARLARIVTSADPSLALVVGARGAQTLTRLRQRGAFGRQLVVGALDDPAAEALATDPATADLDSAKSPSADFRPAALSGLDPTPPSVRAAATDPAHLLFTSGSTGQPKGVVITHANVSAFVRWAVDYFGIRPRDRISGHPPLHFDLSTFDIYGSFRAGAELHLVPPATLLPRQLADLIAGSSLTQWFAVPSTLSYMASHGGLPEEGFPSLERVLWCGEVLAPRVLAQWMRAVGQARFTNLYGPTEATIASSYYTVDEAPEDEAEPIPIGRGCTGEELLVLEADLTPVPDAEPGELYIGGAGLSPGYWRDPARTSAAFPPDPRPGHSGERLYRTGDLARRGADGELHFLGRADSQIKSRGYRIELGEIEAALYSLESVAECAVVGRPSTGFDGVTICCAYTLNAGVSVTQAGLRTALASALPAYMLPSRWKLLDRLPKNPNGKIDRPAVTELFAEHQPVPAGRA
jgi:amino acid adenylation domain-containing protein